MIQTKLVTDFENYSEYAPRPYSITVEKDTNIVLYPSPVTENDVGEIRDTELDLECHLSDSYNKDDSGHYCSVHKAFIPISRKRQLVDLDDIGDVSTYRCPTCTKRIACRRSLRNHAISLQEANEQIIIEHSVDLRLEEIRAVVKLPFNSNPFEQKHRARNNFKQAKQVYKSQYDKPEELKEAMHKAHAELVSARTSCINCLFSLKNNRIGYLQLSLFIIIPREL